MSCLRFYYFNKNVTLKNHSGRKETRHFSVSLKINSKSRENAIFLLSTTPSVSIKITIFIPSFLFEFFLYKSKENISCTCLSPFLSECAFLYNY